MRGCGFLSIIAQTCAVSLTESTGVHSVAGSFIGAAQGPIPQDISWKYAGAVQVGGGAPRPRWIHASTSRRSLATMRPTACRHCLMESRRMLSWKPELSVSEMVPPARRW